MSFWWNTLTQEAEIKIEAFPITRWRSSAANMRLILCPELLPLLAAAFSFPRDPELGSEHRLHLWTCRTLFPANRDLPALSLRESKELFLEPTCQERLSNSSIQPAVSCRCLFFSRFLFISIWEYRRGKGGRGFGVFGAAGAKLQKQVGRVMRVLNGKIPLADARRSVQGCGSKGKGGIGVRFSFSDVLLAILVKFTLFLLVAA